MKKPSQRLRERILDGALRVIQEQGLARASTSAIAKAAGCSEGSIYRYFSGKPELLLEVVRSRLPEPIELVASLPRRAGTATVEANLLEIVEATVSLYWALVPLLGSLFGDAELMAGQREVFGRTDLGPRKVTESVAAYFRAEQGLGRLRVGVDADAAARLLVGGCLGESFLGAMLDDRADEEERDRYARTLVGILVRGLEPEPTARSVP